ncbi:MAG: acetate--CoA ligase family protein, partial [Thermoplasmatales archaeon]
DAEDLIDELRFSSIFKGYRGLSSDREVVTSLLLKVSKLAEDLKFSQVDLNPIFLYRNSYVIVDAKIIP